MLAIRYNFLAYSLGTIVLLSASVGVADETQTLGELVDLATNSTGLKLEQISETIARGKRSDRSEPNLVRWHEEEVTVGVTFSEVAPELRLVVLEEIKKSFETVDREPFFCLRSAMSNEQSEAGNTNRIDSCGSDPTDIDLVVDLSAAPSLVDSILLTFPSDSTHTFLKRFWSIARQIASRTPNTGLCEAGIATDSEAREIVGAAGFVRAPALQSSAAPKLRACATQLSALLLGAIRVRDLNDANAKLVNPYLLKMLYSKEFESGESKASIAEKIYRAALEK